MTMGALEGADLTHCGAFREVQRVYKRVREIVNAAKREARASEAALRRAQDKGEVDEGAQAAAEEAGKIKGIEEKHAVLAKAALGTVMENERLGRRLLAFCRHAMRVLLAQTLPVLQKTPGEPHACRHDAGRQTDGPTNGQADRQTDKEG
jgi:hypothetical protein